MLGDIVLLVGIVVSLVRTLAMGGGIAISVPIYC